MPRLEEFVGREIEPHLDALGELRIQVFREFPYLYDGSLANEHQYLRRYLDSSRSLVVLAFDGDRAVGATTCVPMADEMAEFQAPFLSANQPLEDICYFGESILLHDYRGRGIGHSFFDRREAHARRLGLAITTFCAVDRPDHHPLRPPDYRSLESFWLGRGYLRRPDLRAALAWREIQDASESTKTLTFWLKEWRQT